LQWGPRSRRRSSSPGILSGSIAWCQGFSEPDAGSDLAALKTRASSTATNGSSTARRSGHPGTVADYVFLLARTDPEAPKHAGISYLLVPMKQEGSRYARSSRSTVRADFNEVFFTNARCPRRTSSERQQRLEGGHDHPRL